MYFFSIALISRFALLKFINIWWGTVERTEVPPPAGEYSTLMAFQRDAYQQKQKLWFHLGGLWRRHDDVNMTASLGMYREWTKDNW